MMMEAVVAGPSQNPQNHGARVLLPERSATTWLSSEGEGGGGEGGGAPRWRLRPTWRWPRTQRRRWQRQCSCVSGQCPGDVRLMPLPFVLPAL
jgi:hypothetical protein